MSESTDYDEMELVVLVAIIVLVIIFVGSLVALILLCRHRRRQQLAQWQQDQLHQPMLKYTRDPTLDNLDNASGASSGPLDAADVDDMLQLSPNIAKILKDNDWIYDASGLVHHSLAILRICHQITDQLSGLSFNPVHTNQDAVDDVRDWTRRIMPRVDDLVRTMYLCSRRGVQASLLEARAAALVMAVGGVTSAFRAAYYPRAQACPTTASELQWLRAALRDMEQHLEALRLATEHEENAQREKVEVIVRNPADSTTANSPANANSVANTTQLTTTIPTATTTTTTMTTTTSRRDVSANNTTPISARSVPVDATVRNAARNAPLATLDTNSVNSYSTVSDTTTAALPTEASTCPPTPLFTRNTIVSQSGDIVPDSLSADSTDSHVDPTVVHNDENEMQLAT